MCAYLWVMSNTNTQPTATAYATAKARLTAAIEAKPTAILKTSARLLIKMDGADATTSLLAVLDVLETRMNESEFVAFCDAL